MLIPTAVEMDLGRMVLVMPAQVGIHDWKLWMAGSPAMTGKRTPNGHSQGPLVLLRRLEII